MAERKFHLLEVDLTRGSSRVVDMTNDVKKFVGGRGLGAKILWDRVPKGADPLGPDNVLYFGVGPLTGLWGGVTNINVKSPLTLLHGETNMNGRFGAEMVRAGYESGLLVTGKANSPCYIYIKDDKVEIRDAKHLWGKLNQDCQYQLKNELRETLDDQNFQISSIGPAGEKLVRNADICHDFYHHGARLGTGAVMGSKNLKAVAIRGTRPAPYAASLNLMDMIREYYHRSVPYKASVRRWGHTVSMPERYYATVEGIKNKQLGWDPICDLSNPVLLEQRHKIWNDACAMCPAGCKVPYMRRDPPLGPVVGEMRHDNAGGWNANVMIPGFESQMYLSPLMDNWGIDSEDVSGVVAWMLECYQRGIVTKDDLGGLDLTWGNLEAISKLTRMIVYREGIGDILAEGFKFAPAKIGKGSEKYAMHGKGVAITSYEPRGSMVDAVGLAANPNGALHHWRFGYRNLMMDSLTACTFLTPSLDSAFGGWARWGTGALGNVAGWQWTEEDWQKTASRLVLMERIFALREGHVPERDDVLPERFFTETIYDKSGKPHILNKDQFFEHRKRAYLELGLGENGIPGRKLLTDVGLDFAIPSLDMVD
ncbi:MAG: aldehyde ferredoxin oxidoreductase N-terminal domain-containing protein [Dehalococcoidia bacterium]|nr:aldehyde ferredoxin oxidoreductase N-terminal domain-containing protein [Dehalococcoidia bacterium]MDZ4247620.1 aldehyde ferredoxin oxidoreductase N-terminal domain-containing protein [Dehalococcoidia bacterium]